jgi:membrane-associated phospholipid phosphatase
LAEILNSRALVAPHGKAQETRFWPIDWLVLGYFAFMAFMLAAWWHKIPDAAPLLAWHIAGSALIVFEVKRPNPTSWVFRNWYPLIYVSSCYKEMANFVPLARGVAFDAQLAALDQRIWGVQPTVWLWRIASPGLTELLQWIYTFFIPSVLFVAFVFWTRKRYRDFQYYAFLISLGYLASYLGYVLWPARGPRFLFPEFKDMPLHGLWLFNGMQTALDKLESVAFDAFPSGHTELTILAWWSSRRLSKVWFSGYFAYTSAIIFATVYLRYHYTIDVFAGALLAVILIAATPFLYRILQRGV